MKENLVQDKSFQFALVIIDLYRSLVEKHEFVLSKQLLRSGTSIGANVEEAIAAQSRSDFVAKLSIARKETRETKYWLRLLEASRLVEVDLSAPLCEVDELLRLLTSILKTTRQQPTGAGSPPRNS